MDNIKKRLFKCLQEMPALRSRVRSEGRDIAWCDDLEHIVENAWVLMNLHDTGPKECRFLPGQKMLEIAQ